MSILRMLRDIPRASPPARTQDDAAADPLVDAYWAEAGRCWGSSPATRQPARRQLRGALCGGALLARGTGGGDARPKLARIRTGNLLK